MTDMQYAGFKRRLAAYCIDVIPITCFVAWVCYVFFGFDEALARHQAGDRDDAGEHLPYRAYRSLIRDVSLLVYLAYSAAAECSALQGTFGKHLVGIAVVGPDGGRVSWRVALRRNAFKPVSSAACGLGYLAILWSPDRQAWHDWFAGTRVVRTGGTEVRHTGFEQARQTP